MKSKVFWLDVFLSEALRTGLGSLLGILFMDKWGLKLTSLFSVIISLGTTLQAFGRLTLFSLTYCSIKFRVWQKFLHFPISVKNKAADLSVLVLA